jgi:nicotinate-nucleotide adenylyltransferase
VSSVEDRWNMTVLALEGIPYFEADDREVRGDGWTYTAETLRTFPDDEDLFLIVGADTARGIPTWHDADTVLERVTTVVIPRPGVDRADVDATLAGSSFEWLDTPDVRLSGTMLRRQAASGRSIRFLVREAVWRYVEDNQTYAGRVG